MSTNSPLKLYRVALGLTQAELAATCGVNASAVCKWEKSRPAVDKVLKIEAVTGIPRWRLRPDIYPEPAEITACKIRAAMAPPESPASSVEPKARSAGTPAPSREGAQVASPGTLTAGSVRP